MFNVKAELISYHLYQYLYFRGHMAQTSNFHNQQHTHLSGRGRKIDFGSQRKFQLDMKFWAKSYQKIHDLKKSIGGPNF